jgi:hypothetical protein
MTPRQQPRTRTMTSGDLTMIRSSRALVDALDTHLR